MKAPMTKHRPPPLTIQGTIISVDARPKTPPNMPSTINSQSQRRATNAARARQFLTAVCEGDVATVEKMMTPNLLKTVHPTTACTPLMMAVIFNHSKMVQKILTVRNFDVNTRCAEGRTALHYAAAVTNVIIISTEPQEDQDMYYLLSQAGCKDNTVDLEGFTPFEIRQNPGLINMERARILNTYPIVMDNKIDGLLEQYNEGDLASMIRNNDLDLSVEHPPTVHNEIYDRLLTLQAKYFGIWDAIAAEDDRTLKQLLSDKYMGLCRDSMGKTPLHHAYKRGNRPLIEFLLYLCPEAASMEDKASFLELTTVSKGFPPGLSESWFFKTDSNPNRIQAAKKTFESNPIRIEKLDSETESIPSTRNRIRSFFESNPNPKDLY